jgi:solute carrier family 25 iron transporter 28/37
MSEENDDLEWEEWNPSEITFVKHMIAGSVAGLAEHITIYPIDTIKTHIQYEKSATFQPLHTWSNAKAFLQKDGFFRLWRGVSAMFAGCIPGKVHYRAV